MISARGAGGGGVTDGYKLPHHMSRDDMLSDKCGRHWWEANQIKSIWVVPKLQPNHSEGIFPPLNQ